MGEEAEKRDMGKLARSTRSCVLCVVRFPLYLCAIDRVGTDKGPKGIIWRLLKLVRA